MEEIKLEMYEDAVSAIERIVRSSDANVLLILPDGSVVFENSLNLKLIKKESERVGKEVTFETTDEIGKNLIEMMDTPRSSSREFSTKDLSSLDYDGDRDTTEKKKFLVSLPKVSLKWIKPKLIFLLVIPILVLISGIYFVFWKVPKANVKLVVSSQPLIKSVTVKIKKGGVNDSSTKILAGTAVIAQVSDSNTASTTGEKIIGKKAKGKVKIYNKTDAEKEFKKGTTLVYSKDSKKYKFDLASTVTVPARVDALPPATTSTWGEVDANVEAVEIGESYNIGNGKTLDLEDFKSSEYTATVQEDLTGGESKTIKVVSATDQKALSDALYKLLLEKVDSTLESNLASGQKLIKGSGTAKIFSQEYSALVDAEADSLKLTQTLSLEGLAYSTDDVNKLLGSLLKDFVPDGYELSGEEKQLSVEILGNSDSTILSSDEADVQVTVKTFVRVKINEDAIKKSLVSKKLNEAEKIIGGIKNIKNYEITISPNIPFLTRMPSNISNIQIEVKKE